LEVVWIAPWPFATKETNMLARRVYMHLKPNSAAELTQKIEKDVIPTLRKQKGFQDEITFVSASGSEAFAISLWDRQESAEAYSRASYAEVAKLIENLIEGPAQVETFNVANSTFHKIAAAVAV
jgi:heme-degrading monooxygenase HmoA